MTDREKLDALNRDIDNTYEQLSFLEQREKILASQSAELTRKQRTHRLCTRGGMLESFLIHPGKLTDKQVMELLSIAFRTPDVADRLMTFLLTEESNVVSGSSRDP